MKKENNTNTSILEKYNDLSELQKMHIDKLMDVMLIDRLNSTFLCSDIGNIISSAKNQ